jgi:hypothetical protein
MEEKTMNEFRHVRNVLQVVSAAVLYKVPASPESMGMVLDDAFQRMDAVIKGIEKEEQKGR